mgnify:CR=1 FL=1
MHDLVVQHEHFDELEHDEVVDSDSIFSKRIQQIFESVVDDQAEQVVPEYDILEDTFNDIVEQAEVEAVWAHLDHQVQQVVPAVDFS